MDGMTPKRSIEPADILPLGDYLARRSEERRRMAALKGMRRVEVGPFATFHFESFATIRHQIREMLAIEGGGEAQLADEIAAYGPLIPRGGELVATVMFEIEDAGRRTAQLMTIGGIEHRAFIEIAGERVMGLADPERENTSPEGKASAVQFLHFPLSPAEVEAFRSPGTRILIGFDHPNYAHMAVLPEPVRAALAGDL
jgi:hypothetical protein